MKKWEEEQEQDLFVIGCICKVFIIFSLYGLLKFFIWFFTN